MEEYEKEDLKSFPTGRYGTVDEYGRMAGQSRTEELVELRIRPPPRRRMEGSTARMVRM